MLDGGDDFDLDGLVEVLHDEAAFEHPSERCLRRAHGRIGRHLDGTTHVLLDVVERDLAPVAYARILARLFAMYSPLFVILLVVMKWGMVTVTNETGRRYSVDVQATSTYDAAHLL